MGRPLKILHLEDQPNDVLLVRAALELDGVDAQIVNATTREAFEAALRRGGFDLILSDYALPSFDGLAALAIAHREAPMVPFILVSGTMGEEAAVESLRNGATDYVLKQRLTRLGPVVKRAVNEAQERARRVSAEESQRESEECYRNLVEMSPDALFIESRGRITYINAAGLALFGAETPEQLLGTPVMDRIHPDYQEVVHGRMAALEGGQAIPPLEQKYLRLDGSTVDVEVAAALFPYGGEAALQHVARDITKRKHLEDQLRQAQKMEAVGLLAGGVAHDFNNLLTVILGYSQLTRGRLQPEDPARRNIEEIEKAGARAATLTRQLLAFSRKQVFQPKVLNINLILADTEKMLGPLIGADVEIVTCLGVDLLRTKADPGQIEQVILNLAVNARDAMPQGGKLILETANVSVDGSHACTHGELRPGPYVVLAVSDTGCGMDAATRARIFEPFFTTKDPGKGTGLGLSTVHGIVTQSGGHVEVYSEPGHGTTFKVYLAAVDEAADLVATTPLPTASCRGTETILLVEDEDPVRAVVGHILRESGYSVIEADSGLEALERCMGDPPIDLLLTDVVMPRMSGVELVAKLRERRPDLRALYISGYTELAVIHQGVLTAEMAFLQKPFTPEVLLRKVREILDEGLRRAA